MTTATEITCVGCGKHAVGVKRAEPTAGPWDVSFIEESQLACGRWVALGPKPAANKPGVVIFDAEVCDGEDADTKSAVAANATLAAAAPDLLAALKPFADQRTKDDEGCHRGIVPKEDCSRCKPILAARAAIAKAEAWYCATCAEAM